MSDPITRRRVAFVLLAVNSGATDALGIVSLGGAFTSVMTGNMVLLGLASTRADGSLAIRSGLALLLFIAGAFVGGRIAGTSRPDDSLWPRPVVVALTLQMVGEVLFAIGWWCCGGHPAGAPQAALLGVSAINLGVQSSAILRLGISGLSTTYMTGTLTALVSTLANGGHPRNVMPSVQILAGLVAGAAMAAALARHAAPAVPALQMVPVGYALLTARATPTGPLARAPG